MLKKKKGHVLLAADVSADAKLAHCLAIAVPMSPVQTAQVLLASLLLQESSFSTNHKC